MTIGPWALPAPWPWQADEHRDFGLDDKRAIHADPRIGKTIAALLGLREQFVSHGMKRAMVSAPLKVCPMWAETIAKAGLPVIDCHRLSAAQIIRKLAKKWSGVVLVNDDKAAAVLGMLVERVEGLIVDESHRMKSVSSNRGKALRAIARRAKWVRLLTGTPTGNDYSDLWGQMTALDPSERAWGTSFASFAKRFLVLDPMFPSRVLAHRGDTVMELQALILERTSTKRREDVFGPDSWQIVPREVELPDRARAVYEKLAKTWTLGEDTVDAVITRLLRFQQITSGFVPDGEGGFTMLHTAKIDYAIADLDDVFESGEKAVVWHRFKPEGKAMYGEIARIYGKDVPVWEINGDTKDAESERVAFQAHKGPGAIVVQIQTGGEGINLDTATHGLYLSRIWSLILDKQSRDRIYSPGARRVLTYYTARNTVDETLDAVLAGKYDILEAIRNVDIQALLYGRIRKGRHQ